MKKQNKAARVKSLIEKYKPILFLQQWGIDVEILEEPHNENPYVLADINVVHEYMRSTIRIYPAFFDRPPLSQEEAIIHELCHCITQPAWNVISKFESGMFVPEHVSTEVIENLTQKIAIIAMRSA